MPNIKSAIKRMRTTARQTEVNRTIRSRVSTARRKFNESLAHGTSETCSAAYDALASVLDKAAQKGIIKKNTANRAKSRAHKKLSAIG